MKSRFELPLSLIVFQYYWLGLSDLGEAGTWTWQHSWSQPAYTHWAEGEPDGGGQAGDIVTRAGHKPSRSLKFHNHGEGHYKGLLQYESTY